MLHVRRASQLDTGAMAALLNAIIDAGGTTAITDPVTAEILSDWMQNDGARGAWHVAEDDTGALLGFQWIGPHDDLPDGACDIATFVRIGQTQLGIGTQLFEATKSAARALGYDWINAGIRADNSDGLAYYQSRGFETWDRRPGVTLADGTRVDKIFKRYEL